MNVTGRVITSAGGNRAADYFCAAEGLPCLHSNTRAVEGKKAQDLHKCLFEQTACKIYCRFLKIYEKSYKLSMVD